MQALIGYTGSRHQPAWQASGHRLKHWIVVATACLTMAASSVVLTPPSAASDTGDCFDFSDYLPDNISIAGCWDCEVDVHWWDSLFSWSWKFTLDCTSGDGSTYTVSVT